MQEAETIDTGDMSTIRNNYDQNKPRRIGGGPAWLTFLRWGAEPAPSVTLAGMPVPKRQHPCDVTRLSISCAQECFSKVVVCRPQVAARGHTGYLTFARKSTVPVVLGGAARDPGVEGGDGGDDAEDEDVPSSQGAGAEGADE